MGIVFHTQYSGKTMDNLSVVLGAVKGSNRNVFLASAYT